MKLHLLALSFLSLAACGGAEAPKKAEAAPAAAKPEAKPEAEKAAPPPPKAEEKAETPIVVDDGTIATVNLTANDAMKFNTAEIKIASGRTVKLTLKHVGKMPAEMMGHNFVLLAQGTDVAAFSAAGVTAKDTDYIAAAMKDKVLAQTKLIGGGASDSIEFAAPAPGTYDFLCTFPGHSAIMRGKLVVT